MNLSAVLITQNSQAILKSCLKSVGSFADEIIIIDGYSEDSTEEICRSFKTKFYKTHETNLGKKRAIGLLKAKGPWILAIDADEVVSKQLALDIKEVISKSGKKYDGYLLPYQNHFLGRPVNYGGEDYKMLRLFRKSAVLIRPALVHEHFTLKSNRVGALKSKIYHYSYRSLAQVYRKFTDYARREAREKFNAGEGSSLKKLTLYPLHMFWARFVKDRGFEDGFFRIPLDLGFAYMEFVTYVILAFYKVTRKGRKL